MRTTNRTTQRVALGLAALLVVPISVLAECPIGARGTVFVQAPLGNLIVETTEASSVQVEVTFPGIRVDERCFADHVEISGVDPERVYENVDWHLRVPGSVDLDLVTLAGSIRIQNTDGAVTASTQGGSVTTGHIGGAAAISTQGGSIVTGNIGGAAELRSLGGEIQIGDVGGNAELTTGVGAITVGTVSGSVRAETAGGTISVEEVHGPLTAVTTAGDITLGTAEGRVQTQTGGGNIVASTVRGPFRGLTDFGDVEIGRAESSIEATSNAGSVNAMLFATTFDGDLHITLEANGGDARLSIPAQMPASLEAMVDGNSQRNSRVRSDFPLKSPRRPDLPEGLGPQFTVAPSVFVGEINGGGHAIRVWASGGNVEIRKLPE